MTRNAEYKTLNDGSIDYRHYIGKSHAIRSQGAHRALNALAGLFSGLFRRAIRASMDQIVAAGSTRLAPRSGRPLAARPVRSDRVAPQAEITGSRGF